MDVTERIAEITACIETDASNTELYMERGKLHNKSGNFGSALNDFMRVIELDPKNTAAAEYIDMINEILNFRYTDIYNP